MPRSSLLRARACVPTFLLAAIAASAFGDAAERSNHGSSRRFAVPTNESVRESLSRPMSSHTFEGADLADVIDHFRDVINENIFVNWKALKSAGVQKDTPVTFQIANGPIASDALTQILRQVGGDRASIRWEIDEGVVVVTLGDDLGKSVLTHVYDVRPLVKQLSEEKKLSPEDAVNAIVRTVQGLDPMGYRELGGAHYAIKSLSGQLIITQTPEGHARIAALLKIQPMTAMPATKPTPVKERSR